VVAAAAPCTRRRVDAVLWRRHATAAVDTAATSALLRTSPVQGDSAEVVQHLWCALHTRSLCAAQVSAATACRLRCGAKPHTATSAPQVASLKESAGCDGATADTCSAILDAARGFTEANSLIQRAMRSLGAALACPAVVTRGHPLNRLHRTVRCV
jgi:hypothetical protein